MVHGEKWPRGLARYIADAGKPLPGSPPYCLTGKTAQDGYFLSGEGLRRTYFNATVPNEGTRLYLRINDDSPNNGNGQFLAHIQVWRG